MIAGYDDRLKPIGVLPLQVLPWTLRWRKCTAAWNSRHDWHRRCPERRQSLIPKAPVEAFLMSAVGSKTISHPDFEPLLPGCRRLGHLRASAVVPGSYMVGGISDYTGFVAHTTHIFSCNGTSNNWLKRVWYLMEPSSASYTPGRLF